MMNPRLCLLLPLAFAAPVQAEEPACDKVYADVLASFVYVSQCAELMTETERMEAAALFDIFQQHAERCQQKERSADTVPLPADDNAALKNTSLGIALKNTLGNPIPRERAVVAEECRRQTLLPVMRQRYRLDPAAHP